MWPRGWFLIVHMASCIFHAQLGMGGSPFFRTVGGVHFFVGTHVGCAVSSCKTSSQDWGCLQGSHGLGCPVSDGSGYLPSWSQSYGSFAEGLLWSLNILMNVFLHFLCLAFEISSGTSYVYNRVAHLGFSLRPVSYDCLGPMSPRPSRSSFACSSREKGGSVSGSWVITM